MENDANSQTDASLDSSGAANGLEGSQSSGNEDPLARLNGVMSLYHKEQAEAARLREQLATQIARTAELERVAEERKSALESEIPKSQDALTELQQKVALLEAERTALATENTRLEFLRANSDLMAYAEVLPRTADKAALEAAAQTIRAARAAESDRIRGNLTAPAGGVQAPRRPTTMMTPAEIEKYLNDAKDPATFEARLKELSSLSFT